MRPTSQAVAYALTFLQAEKETTAELSLGTSGAFRLLVNGVKASSDDRYNLPRLDQTRVLVRLRKGINRVLLKVCQDTGPLGFFFRRSAAEASSVGVKVVLPDQVPPLEKGPPPSPLALPTLTDALARQVKQRPTTRSCAATTRRCSGGPAATTRSDHTAAVEAAKAADEAPADAELQLLAGQLVQDDHDKQRAALRAGGEGRPHTPGRGWRSPGSSCSASTPSAAGRCWPSWCAEAPRLRAGAWCWSRALEALGERVARA